MSRDKDRLPHYLEHVLEAIRRIERYTVDMSEQGFMKNEMTQDAVIRNIEIIGEASYNVEVHYPEFAAANPALPLAFAYQMRNAVAHGYSTVDLKIVWTTIRNDLPGLYQKVQTLIQDLPPVAARPAARRPRA
jgi:uncharacterized protein with HEPN domain